MIEKIALPSHFSGPCCNSFKITNQTRKLGVTRNADQHVDMIRHQKEKLQIPATRRVIPSRGLKKHMRDFTVTKLVRTPCFAANRYEIHRAKSAVKMNRMIEWFSNRSGRSRVDAHITGGWVNRPTYTRNPLSKSDRGTNQIRCTVSTFHVLFFGEST